MKSFEPFTEAEQKLIDEAHLPERTVVGDGEMPNNDPGDDVIIRAEVVRHLLLSRELHDKGVRLRGAKIIGTLDLQGCDCARDISLTKCQMDDANLINAQLRGIHLMGCHLGSISADNAGFTGSIYLRGDTIVRGEMSLAGARVAGDVQICGATIQSPSVDAIFAPSLRIEGSLFLGNYPYSKDTTELHCEGMIFLSSARIEHDVFVSNTAISLPGDSLDSGVFDPTEEHGSDIAISLARARVGGILYMQANQINRGIVNLAGAQVARLNDEPVGPGAAYPVRLDGFTYTDFSRHAETNISARLDWLERLPKGMPFNSQPYEQLAKVLESMGHRNDVYAVLMRKERLLRAENRRLLAVRGRGPITRALAWVQDMFLRYSIGYGYRPGNAIVVAIILILSLGFFFDRTWKAGDMAPNAAPILVSKDWISATQTHPENPAAFWATKGQAGQDWETFNAFAYAADLTIPLVSLGQESAWAPSTSRSWYGQAGWWIRWFAKALGWIVTALVAAAITGVIRKD